MIGLQRIEVEGKRFVLLEEGEYERLWTCIQAEVRREHAHLAAQRIQRRSVGVFARRRPRGHPASDAVHDALPVQTVSLRN